MTTLGIYVDDVYRTVNGPDGTRISVDRAFLLFACEVGHHFDGTVVFGRSLEGDTHADYVLPADVGLAALPYYSSLQHFGALARSIVGTSRAMWDGLGRTDVVWVFGPHPYGLLLVVLARLRRRKVVLGVRQDTLEYFRRRTSGRSRATMGGIRLLDFAFTTLGRILPVTGVGRDLAQRYGSRRGGSLPLVVSLVGEADIAQPRDVAPAQSTVSMLTVGRLDREKNPRLLIEALARLEAHEPGRFRLLWVGRGELEDEIRSLAAERGVEDAVTFRGYVPFGDELLSLYRNADMFVHVSFTEGVPQVIVEALASGAPVVATAVGGVPWLLQDGGCGELVPPDDLEALVATIRRVADVPELAARLSHLGVQAARTLTSEAQSEIAARFIRDA